MIVQDILVNFKQYDSGQVWIRSDVAPAFEKAHLVTIDTIMLEQKGKFFKKKADREVLRLELEGSPICFLKRHFHTNFADTLYSITQGRSPLSPARLELEAIANLDFLGISTLQPLAFGEEYSGKFKLPHRSFIITQEVIGIKLEEYLIIPQNPFYQHFDLRCRLVKELALIARTMHENNLHHQDFYLGHLILNWITPDDFTITLIDLQRVRFRYSLDRRWCIKDLAQLSYSVSQISYITQADRLRFLKQYLQLPNGVEECSRECHYHPSCSCGIPPCVACQASKNSQNAPKEIRCWLSQIQKKVARIERHDKKIQLRRTSKNSYNE